MRASHVAGLKSMNTVFAAAIVAALRDMKARYVMTYAPEGVERTGWHAIDLRLTRRKGVLTARRGYFVAPQTP